MENASKALIIAGAVLLALLITGSLVFMYNSIRELKTMEASDDDVKKLLEYQKEIETFNRSGLYGSEVLSLANLVIDYNERQAELKGYQPITLEITINNDNIHTYFTLKNYNAKELVDAFNELNNKVSETRIETPLLNSKITVEKIANMNDWELEEFLIKNVGNDNAKDYLREKANEYENLKTELTQFKRKMFIQPEFEYDKYNGRTTKIVLTDNEC